MKLIYILLVLGLLYFVYSYKEPFIGKQINTFRHKNMRRAREFFNNMANNTRQGIKNIFRKIKIS